MKCASGDLPFHVKIGIPIKEIIFFICVQCAAENLFWKKNSIEIESRFLSCLTLYT